MHFAAFGGYDAVYELLLDHGAKVDAADGDGMTALHIATKGGQVAVCKLLLKCCADMKKEDNNSETAFNVASNKKHVDVCKLLTDWDACVMSNRLSCLEIICLIQ